MSSLPLSHSYLQTHYTSPEEPSKDSRLQFLKKFVSRCVSHFIRSQNEFNANVVRTLDNLHLRSEQNEQHLQTLSNTFTQITNSLRQQQRINNRTEELHNHLIGSVQSIQDMQSHHGGIIAQALQKINDFEQTKLVNLLDLFRTETQALSKRQDDLVSNQNQTNDRQSTLISAVKSLNTHFEGISKRQNDLVALLESFKNETQSLVKRHDDLVGNQNRTDARQVSLVEKLSAVTAFSDDISRRQNDLVKLLESFRNETQGLSKRHDDLVSQLHSYNLQQADLAASIKSVSSFDTDFSHRIDSAVKDITSCSSRLAAVENQCIALNASLNKALQRMAFIKDSFDEAVAHIPAESAALKDQDAFVSSLLDSKKLIADESYMDFEDANRGSEEDILQRLSFYLSKLSGLKTSPKSYILDVGCGRGEFLQLLADNDFHAKGIDSNKIAVKHAKAKGFSVKCTDLFTELERLKPESLAAISAFHVIEHLPFNMMYRFIELAYTRIKPDGLLLLETPNALNLRVAACEFYRDPTHIRPVHPSTLEYIVKQVGFSSIAFDFLHPFPDDDSLTTKSKSFSKPETRNFSLLNDLILGCRDCAAVATKKDVL